MHGGPHSFLLPRPPGIGQGAATSTAPRLAVITTACLSEETFAYTARGLQFIRGMGALRILTLLPLLITVGCVGAVPEQGVGGVNNGGGLGDGLGNGGGDGIGNGGGNGGGDGLGNGGGNGGGDGIGNGGGQQTNIQASNQAFTDNVVPLMAGKNCVGCHPAFASHDGTVNSQYMGTSSQNSRFVNVTDPHAGANPGWSEAERATVRAWAVIYFNE